MALLQDIATLSDKITLIERRDDAERKPSFTIDRPGKDIGHPLRRHPDGP